MAGQFQPSKEAPPLTVSPEKVCFLIVKVREVDAKDIAGEGDSSNPTDDRMISGLEDRDDDAVLHELISFISGLSEDEQIDLVALAWLGRDDCDVADGAALREEAARLYRGPISGTALPARPAADQRFSRGRPVAPRPLLCRIQAQSIVIPGISQRGGKFHQSEPRFPIAGLQFDKKRPHALHWQAIEWLRQPKIAPRQKVSKVGHGTQLSP
jgi:hypothetical protein